MAMHIITVPYHSDNYGYFVYREGHDEAFIIDPGDAVPFLELTQRYGRVIGAILCTHHHRDHVGGIEPIVRHFPRVRVFAHRRDMHIIPHVTDPTDFNNGASSCTVDIQGTELTALSTPGHTSGSVCWRLHDALFTGDTLFTAGCGRLFEGTAEQMCRSLYNVINALPSQTDIYCGHNYALSNLRFARVVEPDNIRIPERMKALAETIRNNGATVPSCLDAERETNPFLRCETATVKSFAYQYIRSSSTTRPTNLTLAHIFRAVRSAKDTFTG